MSQERSSLSNIVEKFFGNTASSYENIVRFTTFGKDKFWKQKIIEQVSGNTILDLACGTGILTRMIAAKLPNSKIIGVDITPGYLEVAKKNSKKFANISFVNQDAEKLNLETKFDCITGSYIPKYCNAEILINQCIKHLNPGGMIILHDFACPKNKIVKSLWRFHFVLLNILGIFIPHWKEAFKELPKLICSSNWIEDYVCAMKENKINTELKMLTWQCCGIIFGKLESQKYKNNCKGDYTK